MSVGQQDIGTVAMIQKVKQMAPKHIKKLRNCRVTGHELYMYMFVVEILC